jgi:hypothetical protein
MLKEVANVDCSYNLTPEELYAKVAESDALIVRSATKVRHLCFPLRSKRSFQQQVRVAESVSCRRRSPGRCSRPLRAG